MTTPPTPHPEQALRAAREYLADAATRYYDGTGGDCKRKAAARVLAQIDAALAALRPQAAPDDDDDLLTIAFMSGVERGKELARAAQAEPPEAAMGNHISPAAAALTDEDVWTAIDRFAAKARDFYSGADVIALDDLRRVLPEAAEPVAAPVPDDTDPIVGHKTFSNGLSFRHEPLRASEAERIMAAVDDAKKRRAEQMPTEQDAVRAMWEAYRRLEELGWRNATYCPRDGRTVLFIEAGSSGIHEGHCDDQDRAHRRPTVWLHGAGDLWPSQPVLYRELPAALAQAGDKEQQT